MTGASKGREQQRLHAYELLEYHLHNLPLAVIRWDESFQVADWSPAAEAMFGWTLEQVRGLTPGEWPFVHPEDQGAVTAVISELLSGERVHNAIDNRKLTRDGEVVFCHWHNSIQKDDRGNPLSVLSVVEDVSARRRQEQEHRALADRLATSLECMSDAFFLLDTDWRFSYLNSEAERVLQRSADDLLGQKVWDLFPQAVQARFYPEYTGAMADGRSRHFESYFAPLEDWFEVNAYPSPEGLAVYFRVITERKRLHAELAEAEERFRYVTRATADAVWDWKLESDLVWWSDGLKTLFGYDPEAVEPDSRSWTSRLHPDDRERVLDDIHRAIADRSRNWVQTYRFRRHDGSYALVEHRGFVVRDDDGKAVRMVGGMTDITRSTELEEQLRQAQKLESLGQLTGGVAHDFNNLLTVLQGNAELMVERLDRSDPLYPLAEMSHKAAQRGADLTHRLLAFARRQVLDASPVDINRLLAGMDNLLRRTLREDIDIELVRGGGLWMTHVDESQLESALLNLVLNARDAMPGGGRLTMETANTRLDDRYAEEHNEVTPGQYVMVAVSDTGCGIEQQSLKQLFDPFFSTKEEGKGTGLGLSMVYGFIKQSRGHIKVYSEPGQGTTVRIYLPRLTSQHTVADGTEVVEPAATPGGGRGTVLLVEDDALVCRYAETLLLGMGFDVLAARDGDQAMAIVRQVDDIDLLFTDVIMPGGMNGRDLAEAALEIKPDLKVLYTSGYTENAIVHQGRLDPGVQLLSKPYRRADLERKIRDVLKTD